MLPLRLLFSASSFSAIILLSAIAFTTPTSAARINLNGPIGEADDGGRAEITRAYRSIIDEAQAKRSNVCLACIIAARRIDENFGEMAAQEYRSKFREDKFELLQEIRKQLRRIKAESYERDGIPNFLYRTECTNVYERILLKEANEEIEKLNQRIARSPAVIRNGSPPTLRGQPLDAEGDEDTDAGLTTTQKLVLQRAAYDKYVNELVSGRLDFSCADENGGFEHGVGGFII